MGECIGELEMQLAELNSNSRKWVNNPTRSDVRMMGFPGGEEQNGEIALSL